MPDTPAKNASNSAVQADLGLVPDRHRPPVLLCAGAGAPRGCPGNEARYYVECAVEDIQFYKLLFCGCCDIEFNAGQGKLERELPPE